MTVAADPQASLCPLCGGRAVALSPPHPDRSMLSDGRMVPRALTRLSCTACGAASHASATSGKEIRAFYDSGYQLAAAATKSDAARARAYCNWIESESSTPRSILEIGCGSGALLRELLARWPEAKGYGIDPALPEAVRPDNRVQLQRGFVEDISKNLGSFDLIVAVNVIEHMPNPGKFLGDLQLHLSPNGKVIIVCPAAQPPNLELLFFDHLYSLTPNALSLASNATSLVVKKRALAPAEIGDFQMIVFGAIGPGPDLSPPQHPSFADLWLKRQSYLECWSKLDQALIDRSNSGSRLVAFGGGQTAALLRAYAPRTWARVELIVLDDVNEVWTLGPPIASYQDVVQNLAAAEVLIATSPRAQQAIADRLRSDGVRSIAWNDLIAN